MVETSESGNKEGSITLYVDDQPVTVDETELTVRRLLELSGSSMDTGDGEAILRELRGGQEIEHKDLDETITVTAESRFYTGDAGGHKEAASGGGRDVGSFRSESSNVETSTSAKKGNVETSSFSGQGGGRSPGGPERKAGGNLPTSETATARGGTSGSNVASGTGVPRSGGTSNVGGGIGGNVGTTQGGKPNFSNQGQHQTSGGNFAGQGSPSNTAGQNPKIGGSSGSSIQGSKAGGSQGQGQAFNEGQKMEGGQRRTGEREAGRPGERKRSEEQQT